MTDIDRLREEYDAAVKRRHGKIGATGLEIRAEALIAALEAENERLRCCGNCEHFSSSLYACELWPGHDKDAPESCHFTPSRWKEAER